MKKNIILITLLSFVFSFKSFAFKVSPIEIHFEPSGVNSVQNILLNNDGKENVPIEISVFKRVHKNGKEIREKTNDFSFFPKQLILKPNEKRKISLSWMGNRDHIKIDNQNIEQLMIEGDRKIQFENAYRLEVRQIPLKNKKKKRSGFKFIYNYVASLYVSPLSSKPKIVASSMKRVSKNELIAEVTNKGTAHAILAEYKLFARSSSSDASTELERQPEEVRGINLLPNESRTIKFILPEDTFYNNLILDFEKN